MSIYNEDELNVPNWLDKNFFVKVLGNHENNENIEVVNFELSPASLKGDHYASIMYRAKIYFKISPDGLVKQKSLIIKTIPEEEGIKRDILMQSELFETEIGMYAKTLPKIEQILAQHGDNIKLAPKIIYHSLKPHKVIILEDLCVAGYTTVRGRYLTEHEVRTVYQKLAKMHAVSYMLGRSEDHVEVTKYQSGIFSTTEVLNSPFITTGIKRFIDMLSLHDDLAEYVPKIKAMEPKLFEKCIELFKAYENGSKDDIFVLNHGDFHMKNMMFKFNKNAQLEDFQMVDFQICVYAPSVIDLMYSSDMMLSPELRSKRNILFHFYFSCFVDTLKNIQYKGELPKFADFQIASIKYRHFGVFLLSTFLPFSMSMLVKTADDLKHTNSSDVLGGGGGDVSFSNPAYLEEVKRLLPIYLRAGYLD